MTDNDVIRIFLSNLNGGMTEIGTTVTIQQDHHPTTQGANTAPTMYFYKIGDRRVGSPRRLSNWDVLSSTMLDEDTQLMEATYQLSALARQPDITTASDLLSDAAMIMQGDKFIKALKGSGIGILRITEIRNPYFKDDRDQWQASPSFDFVLSYNRSLTRAGRVISEFEVGISRV